MVHAHVVDSWTLAADRRTRAYYALQWIGGVASPLFLLLAGAAMAMSALSKGRESGSFREGARAARRRGWEIFGLAFLFRLQAELLGFGPLATLLKVDMLNIMGLSMVLASVVWQWCGGRLFRVATFALLTTTVTLVTPAVRAATWVAVLPDPLEAYLRPAGAYAAFPFFPWAGFLFAGVLVGDLVDAIRHGHRPAWLLQGPLLVAGIGGVVLATVASYRPALFPTADFWHDSPTIFFIRLGAAVTLVPVAWLIEGGSERGWLPHRLFRALALLGRSSLFVYWIHVEMVYGLIAEPLKQALPLWATQVAWLLLTLALYRIVVWKNRLMEGHELPRRARILAPILK
jgi:acyltransferase